jgi:thymidylate synthase
MEANFVKARTIEDAWRDVMLLCIRNGWDFVVKGGSYVGQIRKQLQHVTIVITEPGTRPLAPIMPPGLPGPTNEEKIEAYFEQYIMSNRIAENEVYTYGTFITMQIGRVIEILNKANGNTNQACIAIGDTSTTFLSDPPCLRLCSFKVVEGKLDMTVFFRSWDLYAGLPENLGGLQLLKEYVLAHLDFPCEDGALIAHSDGLHIYQQYFGIVDSLNIDKIDVSSKAVNDKATMQNEQGTEV